MNLRPLSLNELIGFTLVAFLTFAVSAWIFECIEAEHLQTALSLPTTIETSQVSGD